MAQLTGKNVLITGALGTIGQAMVARYAEEGANIIALDHPDAPDPQALLDGIAKGVRYLPCDLNNLAEVETKVTALADEIGGIDVLVNNAALVIFKQHDQFTIQEYEDQIRVNSTAVFVLSRIAAKHMKEKRQGKIGLQMAFVEFVENDDACFAELRICQQAAREYAFGQES